MVLQVSFRALLPSELLVEQSRAFYRALALVGESSLSVSLERHARDVVATVSLARAGLVPLQGSASHRNPSRALAGALQALGAQLPAPGGLRPPLDWAPLLRPARAG